MKVDGRIVIHLEVVLDNYASYIVQLVHANKTKSIHCRLCTATEGACGDAHAVTTSIRRTTRNLRNSRPADEGGLPLIRAKQRNG